MKQASFSYSGSELDALSGADNYRRSILRRFSPYLGDTVIEVGAGIGAFSQALLGHGVAKLVLVEPAENLFPRLQERFSAEERVDLVMGELADLPEEHRGRAHSVVAVNVLEHIEEDVAFLETAHSSLAPGGRILLFVPALPWLFGALDEAFGHFRRYTRPVLAERLSRAGFSVLDLRYFNLPGIASWFLAGRVLRRRTIRPGDVRTYDRLVMPWVSRLERAWAPPAGQSLVAVAAKQPARGDA